MLAVLVGLTSVFQLPIGLMQFVFSYMQAFEFTCHLILTKLEPNSQLNSIRISL